MSEIVNLNKARKDRDRTTKKAKADANAARHGRTKAQRLSQAAQEARAKAQLDQLKFEDE